MKKRQRTTKRTSAKGQRACKAASWLLITIEAAQKAAEHEAEMQEERKERNGSREEQKRRETETNKSIEDALVDGGASRNNATEKRSNLYVRHRFRYPPPIPPAPAPSTCTSGVGVLNTLSMMHSGNTSLSRKYTKLVTAEKSESVSNIAMIKAKRVTKHAAQMPAI
jgi:hypothetical protein